MLDGFLVFILIIIAVPLVVKLLAKKKRIDSFNESKYAVTTGNAYGKVASDNGLIGEYLLGRQLEKFAPSCPTFFNLYIPKQGGGMSEIDALLVHPTGIYVFESKNYSGWIFGSESDKNWTQTLNKRSKYQFPNPVRQNEGHIRALEAYLGLRREMFYSVVVFGENCVLKRVDTTNVPVVQTADVAKFLQDVCSTRSQMLSLEGSRVIAQKLVPCAHASDAVKEQHIAELTGKAKTSAQYEAQQVPNSTANASQVPGSRSGSEGYWKHTQPIDSFLEG